MRGFLGGLQFIGKLFVPLFLLSSGLLASTEDFRRVLGATDSEVVWDSQLHRHQIHAKSLDSALNQLLSLLVHSEAEFLAAAEALSADEQAALRRDSLDSRVDPFDVLSVELKLRMEALLSERFGEAYHFNHSEIWSLAKHRLRSLLGVSSQATGLSVFRRRGLDSDDYILACAEAFEAQEDLFGSQVELVEWAGFHFVRTKQPISWGCRNESFQSQWKPHSQVKARLRLEEDWNWSKIEADGELRVLATIGLIESLPSRMIDVLGYYLRWKLDFNKSELKEIDIRESVGELLPRADLFVSLVNMPHANDMGFSMRSPEGRLLSFERLAEDGMLHRFDVILPPASSKNSIQNGSGVRLSQSEIAAIFPPATSFPAVLDMACYSERYLKDWLSLMTQVNAEAAIAPIVLSQAGQRAERPWEIFMVLDIVASAIQGFYEKESLASAYERLARGSIWQRLAGRLHGGWRSGDPNPFLFEPLLSVESENEAFRDWYKYKSLHVKSDKDPDRIYPPAP